MPVCVFYLHRACKAGAGRGTAVATLPPPEDYLA